jgi:hypothetical protein
MPIAETAVGWQVTELRLYRRPVDLPTLQPVTPEAMAELEQRQHAAVVVLYPNRLPHTVFVRFWNTRNQWHVAGSHPMTTIDRPTAGWFIDLSTIPEVRQ